MWFPPLALAAWRMPTDIEGIQIPNTFCATGTDVEVTAKVSLGVMRVHPHQDTTMLVFQEKANLACELFNGSLPP